MVEPGNGEARTGVAVLSQRVTDCQGRSHDWRQRCEQELDKVNTREEEIKRDLQIIKTEIAVGHVRLDTESKRFVALVMAGGALLTGVISALVTVMLR